MADTGPMQGPKRPQNIRILLITDHGFWNPPCLRPLNWNVGTFCLRGLWGPQESPPSVGPPWLSTQTPGRIQKVDPPSGSIYTIGHRSTGVQIWRYIIPYYTIPYYTILYYTVLLGESAFWILPEGWVDKSRGISRFPGLYITELAQGASHIPPHPRFLPRAVLYYIRLEYAVLCCIVFYYVVLYDMVLYCILLYYTFILLYCII